MEFTCRVLNNNDYDDILVGWWKDWRWPEPPPKDMLPQNGTCGLIISKGDVDICAGFLYLTNSKTAWIEYVISNFNYKESDRKEALEVLINALSMTAKEHNNKYIFTSLKSNPLIHRYKACGFIEGSTGCTELIKAL